MPTIPLITETNYLPDVPDAVLDRERRPTVDNSALMQAVGRLGEATRMPDVPLDLARPYEALGSIGRAIADAGSVIGAVGQKKMEAESEIQVGKAESVMQDTRAKFEEWRLKNPDASSWAPEWKRRLGEVQTQLLEKTKLHNLAYNRIVPQLTRYADNSMTEVELAATKETFAQAKGVYLSRINEAAQTLNRPKMIAVTREGVANGYLHPHEADAGMKTLDAETDRQQRAAQSKQVREEKLTLKAEIDAGPAEYLAKNPQPASEQDKDWEMRTNYAKQKLWEYQAGAVDEINEKTQDGTLTYGAEVELWNNQNLGPEVRKEHADYVRERELPLLEKEESPEYNRLLLEDRVAQLDPDSKDKLREYYEITRDIRQQTKPEAAGELINQVREKFNLPPQKLPERKPAEKQVSKWGRERFNPYFGPLAYDRTEVVAEDRATNVRRAVDFDRRRKVLEGRLLWETAMNDAIKMQPELLKRPEELQKIATQAMPPGIRTMILEDMEKASAAADKDRVSTPGYSSRAGALRKLQLQQAPKNKPQ